MNTQERRKLADELGNAEEDYQLAVVEHGQRRSDENPDEPAEHQNSAWLR